MRILFWNTHKNKSINPYIASLVYDNDIDVLVLSEYDANVDELNKMFEGNNQRLTKCNTLGCERIDVWTSYANIKSGIQEKYYSIQIINDDFVLCCIHLCTDLYGDHSDERLAIIQRIMYDVKKIEEKIESQRTIVIGDINEMPYGRGCLNANGFHGLPALDISDKPTRTVNEIEYRKFYNPMWNLMGDFSYPPGTYYINQSKLHSPMWYMLDQIIISQDVLPLFSRESLKIITTCSYADLVDDNKHPNRKISDHFPIMCEIEDEKKCGRSIENG